MYFIINSLNMALDQSTNILEAVKPVQVRYENQLESGVANWSAREGYLNLKEGGLGDLFDLIALNNLLAGLNDLGV